jgi:tetratricopeptide (TPR) repeat protein
VAVRLPADRAAFETEAWWCNPTTSHQSCYQWMTAAEEAGDDLVMAHPGDHYLEHGGIAHPWPRDDAGHALDHYRDNAFGSAKSYHVLGAQAEWFGGWWTGRGTGYGHWSLAGDKPGQKVWLWSLARDGGIWRDLLTDDPAPQYIEVQSGLMHSQADENSGATPFKHAALEPGAALHWSELWFPVRGLGGLVDASPWGALEVAREGDAALIAVCPLRALDEELRVTVGGEVVHRQRLAARPLETVHLRIGLGGRAGALAVEVGEHLLAYRDDDAERHRLHRPLAAAAAPDPASAEGLFTAGEDQLRQRFPAAALAAFTRCLAVEPCHLRALVRVAELRSRRGEPELALAAARLALAQDATDAGANLAYAVASDALGQVADAKDGFAWAARSGAYRAIANARLAALALRERDWWRAGAFAARCGDGDEGADGVFIAAVLARLQGRGERAAALQAQLLARDPLHHGARFERYALTRDAAALAAFTAPLRSESPDQTCIELALQYAGLGLDADALAVLDQAPPRPLVAYWQAWLRRDRDPAASDHDLERALAASPRGVFPARVEALAMLRWAQQRHPHWKNTYYLGLLLASLGREDEALALLDGCGAAPDDAVFYLNRARLHRAEAERPRLLADLRRAQELDPGDWRAGHLLARACLDVGDGEGALAALAALAAAQRAVPGNQALVLDRAAAQLAAGRPREALAVLETATILPSEGAAEGHQLYRRAQLSAAIAALAQGDAVAAAPAIAQARSWPERLGSGRPYEPDERLADFLEARRCGVLGDHAGAASAWARIAASPAAGPRPEGCATLLTALALRELGEGARAAALLDAWRPRDPRDAVFVAWARAIYAGDAAGARAALIDPQTGVQLPPWRLARRERDFPLIAAAVALPARTAGKD